jgi:hypothetical protein
MNRVILAFLTRSSEGTHNGFFEVFMAGMMTGFAGGFRAGFLAGFTEGFLESFVEGFFKLLFKSLFEGFFNNFFGGFFDGFFEVFLEGFFEIFFKGFFTISPLLKPKFCGLSPIVYHFYDFLSRSICPFWKDAKRLPAVCRLTLCARRALTFIQLTPGHEQHPS